MTRREAQDILLSCRPGHEPADDPLVNAALELLRTDAELAQWYEQHRAWDAAMRRKFAALQVPADLKARILAGPNIIVGPAHWWQRRAVLMAAAAMIALLITVSVMFLNRPAPSTGTFAEFRSRMIGTVLREYRMDLETNNMSQIRAYLASQGAPADYTVPAGLQTLKLAGCGKLTWEGKPVSMVCYEDEQNRLVWMFVARAGDWSDQPPAQPAVERVISCQTASWSQGDSVYVIGAETSEAALRKLL